MVIDPHLDSRLDEIEIKLYLFEHKEELSMIPLKLITLLDEFRLYLFEHKEELPLIPLEWISPTNECVYCSQLITEQRTFIVKHFQKILKNKN